MKSLSFRVYVTLLGAMQPMLRAPGAWRLVSWIRRFEPDDWPELAIRRNGIRWRLWYRLDHVSKALLYAGVYEKESTALVRAIVKPSWTCIDLGANCGYFSVLMGTLSMPGGRVVAFEPSETFAARLQENVRLNGLTNVRLVQAGVSDASGTLTLTRGGCNAGFHDEKEAPAPVDFEARSRASYARHQEVERTQVRVTTLDQELADLGITHVDFIKMDVEGFEAAVIRGGMSTIAQSRPWLLFEYKRDVAPGVSRGVAEIAAPLEALGYRFLREDKPAVVHPSTASLERSLEGLDGLCNVLAIPPGQVAP